jgi:acyl-CoA synthetase (AMP-forming)/AMP-acid ligase II
MPICGPLLEEQIAIPKLLSRGLEKQPDAPALVSMRERWTWRELDEVTTRLAANLLDLGLEPGDRVASLMPNRCELLIHFLACLKAGLVATPLNYRYMAPEIDHALEVSEASILLAHQEREDDLAASKLAGNLPRGRINYSDDGASANPSFAELTVRKSSRTLATPDPDAPAIIFFTSGSTGKPKGATHTFATLGWILASMIRGYEMRPTDTMLPGLSLSHVGGVWHSLMTLAVGGRVLVARTFVGDELLPLMRDERPTVLLMLPSALFALVRDHGARQEDFAMLRACFSGGDKVSVPLESEFTKLAGFNINELYGMTEIGITSVNPPSAQVKLSSVGLVTPGNEISIRDENKREVPSGTEGRLWVKFAGNMVGYWNRPDVTAETIVDGWLDTGDVMRIDEDGYLWFCGRKKQIIVHDGSNICPQEVEEALLAHVAVAEAGVVGVHNLLHGENVRAFITLKEDAKRPHDQDLIQFARKRIGYKAPEEIVVLDQMPLNATGKVDRVALKQMTVEQTQGVHRNETQTS